jgi:uncharacterized protein (TIGR00369 family)
MSIEDTPRRAAILTEFFGHAPMKQTFGMELSYTDEGNAVFEMPYKESLCHAMKDTHGGAIATLIDNAGWFTAATRYDHWISTSEMTVRLHEPAHQEDLHATGQIVRAGKRMCSTTMEVRTTGGRLVATGAGTFVVSTLEITPVE